jgi:SAM-dependent methyltransferase
MQLLKRVAQQFTPQKIAYRYRQLQNALIDNRKLWDKGIDEELDFWNDVFHNPASPHYRHPVSLANPDLPFQDYLKTLLEGHVGEHIRVLDLGAGPVTQLGYVWENHTIHITPIDPLADDYNSLLASVGCTPPFPTQRCHAEEIGSRFEAESFDLVFSRNALDHAYDPMEALRQARKLLKPGGFIFLRHKRNEGKRIYGGLHQWNFDIQDGEFVLWNMKRHYVIAKELHPVTVASHFWQDGNYNMVDAQIQKPKA